MLPALNLVYDALYTGDLSFAAARFDEILATHTYEDLIDANTGLVTNADLSALIDTSGGSDDGFVQSRVNAVVNAWVYEGLREVARLARWLNRTTDSTHLDAVASALASGFATHLVNGSHVCDGVCVNTPHTAAHSTFYALSSGVIADPVTLSTLAATLRTRIDSEGNAGVPCGAYPVQFLLRALYADGSDHGTAAYGVLTSTSLHSWRHMMEVYGATATMEAWLPEELDNLSFSHVWSSSPAILIPRYFFGVVPTAPGFAAFDVKPQPGPVRSGSASLPTVRGAISLSFDQTVPSGPGGCFTLRISMPGGTSARALLPRWGLLNVTVRLDGTPLASSTFEGDYVVVAGVTPGTHVMTTC